MAEQQGSGRAVAGRATERHPTRHGAGRVLIAVYAVFALSATARAGVQLITAYHRAPLAYWLSALSGVVYIAATVALARASDRSRQVAAVAVAVELVGVLSVGTWTIADPGAFTDASVWSDYGSGYGYVPLVLPFLGLAWLARTRSRQRAAMGRAAGADQADVSR